MNALRQRFRALTGSFAVCRLPPGSPLPSWVAGDFYSVTATHEELSIICPTKQVPIDVRGERDWRGLKLEGPFPLSAVGVLASVAVPLADAGISMLCVATYDTDYLLVKGDAFENAVAVLVAAGHEFLG